MAAKQGKTVCLLCGASLWNYHVKLHMSQYHFHGSMNRTPCPPRFEDENKEHVSDDGSNGHEEEDDDECSSEEGMFDDERTLSLETYLKGLPEESYNPKRVLKYMNWTTRAELSPREKEAVQFLRTISFGGGLSTAHAHEVLNYARGLGGIQLVMPHRCMYIMMYIEFTIFYVQM